MSTTLFAGYLCATHVGENIKHELLPGPSDWRLRKVMHSWDIDKTRIVCVAYPKLPQGGTMTLDLDPREIVTVTA
jgi:hypothetical protein